LNRFRRQTSNTLVRIEPDGTNRDKYLSVSSVSESAAGRNSSFIVCVFEILADGKPSPIVNVVSTVVEVINGFKSRAESCARWGFGNYKTFDGKVYGFQSDCTYTLVSDVKTNSFHVQARHRRGTVAYINIYVVDNLYQIRRDGRSVRGRARASLNGTFRFQPPTVSRR